LKGTCRYFLTSGTLAMRSRPELYFPQFLRVIRQKSILSPVAVGRQAKQCGLISFGEAWR
jgi:hypothetical protein